MLASPGASRCITPIYAVKLSPTAKALFILIARTADSELPMIRHRIAALCSVQPKHRCKALANTPPPEDRGRNERSQSLSLRSAPGAILLSLGVAEGPGKAADSGSIIRIDPKSAVYVSDIRPQWVEITH